MGVPFHDPIKKNKLKPFGTAEITKKVSNSQNKITQIRADRNILGQLLLLAVKYNIDLEVTLIYPLSPIPWLLAIADGIPVKTDKSKQLYYIELLDFET